MRLSVYHLFGIILVVIFMCLVGAFTGKNTKNADDFNTGNSSLTALTIIGTITGTLVGGASTIATTQLAFEYGYSAIWFNVGTGLGCFCLGIFFVDRLRKNKILTIQEMLESKYGIKVGVISAVFASLGIFLSIIAQLFSAITILTTIFPMSLKVAAVITCLIMASYVIFGGIKGTGIVGIIKLFLLYCALIFMVVIAFKSISDFSKFIEFFPKEKYFNVFSRGIWKDLSGCLSLILGVICTQTYIQVVIAGKNKKSALHGTIISSLLIPPISIAGIFIGMYMKYYFPEINSSLAFSLFVIEKVPDFWGGIILGTLFIVITGSGAGLVLGICSILSKSIYPRVFKKQGKELFKIRITIIVILFLAFCTTLVNGKNFILEWSFMALGLRAMTAFFPMCTILFLKKDIDSKYILASIVMSPLISIILKLIFKINVDILFIGLITSFVIIFVGYISQLKNKPSS